MRNILSRLTIATVLFIALLAISSSSYAINYECGLNATGNLSNGVFTITGTGRLYNFSGSWETPWHSNSDSIEKVIVGEGITVIGSHFFAYCSNLRSVQIPQSVESIEKNAFYECSSLSKVIIPDNPKRKIIIKQQAFRNTDLRMIYLPSAFYIERLAFDGCRRLANVYYPGASFNTWRDNGRIEDSSYDDSPLLYATWHYNYSLNWSYNYTWSSDNRQVTATRTEPNLEITETETANTYFSSQSREEGVSYAGDFLNPSFKAEKKLKTLCLPAGITQVDEEAFMNDKSFQAVIIPSSCKKINSKAFANNPNLQVVIAFNTEKASDAFDQCPNVHVLENRGQYAIYPGNSRIGDRITYSNGTDNYRGIYY